MLHDVKVISVCVLYQKKNINVFQCLREITLKEAYFSLLSLFFLPHSFSISLSLIDIR